MRGNYHRYKVMDRSQTAPTRSYKVVLTPDTEEGGFVVTVPALRGVVTEGDTREEAVANAREAIALYIADLVAHGEPIPDDVDVEPVEIPAA
jgi:antitoxin HicB